MAAKKAAPKQVNISKLPKVEAFGRQFPEGAPMYAVHLTCYRDWDRIPTTKTKFEHFIEAARIIFSEKKGGNGEPFIWHPWAEDMLDACLRSNYVGFAGSSSCGKSAFLAVWLLLNWMADLYGVMSLATSTNVRDARKRVWGAVEKYYRSVSRVLPGVCKMVNNPTPAIHAIRDGHVLSTAGVYLIPSEAKNSEAVTGKMRGMKAERGMYLGADELTDLSPAVVTTALSNLSNNKFFHMVAAANPNTYYDPFAMFVKPKDGWDSISVDDSEWETSLGGICLHFDALKNPNYLARENKWPIQPFEKIEEAIERIGDKPEFWRDFRAFWCPEGVGNYVYTGQEIVMHSGDKPAVWGHGKKIRFAGFDPAFTSGGDRPILRVCDYGASAENATVIEFKKSFQLSEDPSNKTDPRNLQVARKLVEALRSEGVDPRNLGVDVTGGGAAFCDLLATVMGRNDFLRVNFGGRATDRPISPLDPTKSSDKYTNRVTELWFYGAELLRAGQLRGITDDLARELTARKYETSRNSGSRVTVEPKRFMKVRLGYSPDEADAAMIALEVARERLGLVSSVGSSGGLSAVKPFRQAVTRFQRAGSLQFRLNFKA